MEFSPHFKMGHLIFSSLLVVVMVSGIGGQTCNANLPSECYYTGAGTISAGASAQSHQYLAIGGLFDIHKRKAGTFCSNELSLPGITNLMAFFWSVDKFGTQKFVGTQMTAGAIAFDSCMRPDQTIENLLSFSSCKVQVQGVSQQNVIAFVGPYSNKDAARTTMLAKDLKVTLLSPEANYLGFDGTNDYKNLLRLRPNVKYDFKAIVHFLRHHQSNFMLVVYSTDMKNAYEELVSMYATQNKNVCQYFGVSLKDDASDSEIADVAKQVVRYNAGKYIVPLLSKEMTRKLMQATENENDNNLVYILHSDIGRDSSYVKDNAIIVESAPSDLSDLNEFNEYLKNVNANASQYGNFQRLGVENPWLPEVIQQKIVFPDLMKQRPSPMVMNVLRTIRSVKIIIDGFDQGVRAKCNIGFNNYQFCDELRNHEDELYQYIKGAYFEMDGQVNHDSIVYNYYIYRAATADYKQIGIYTAKTDKAVFTEDLYDNKYGLAFDGSVCPQSLACCIPPTTKAPTQATTQEPNVKTTSNKPSDLVIVIYPKDKEITGAFSNMPRPDEDYGTRFDLGHKWIIALGVLAGLGIVCVFVFEIYILYKMVGKKVDNKWRTMWLGQLLLFGIFLAYLTCFAYLFIPTKATCGITRFGVGVAYAICFAVLLVKLMVILTSKTSEVYMPGDMDSPNYLKGVYQFLMFVFAVGVQVVINIQWLITVPPEAIQVVSNAGEKVWVCNHYTWETGANFLDMATFVRTNFENHLLSLTYIMVMILIITILSLNAHGIITNHRESVFIGIAAGFSIPLWLAWGLVGGLNKDNDYGHEYGDACIAFGLFLTATLILFSMFLPKVRQLVNMGVEGIYLEDDRDTIYGGSIIMAPPSYKSKGPSSVIYVNNQGIYSEPVVVGNGETMATHLKHPMSTYSAPPTYLKKTESTYGGSRVLRVTDDLKGRHPNSRSSKKPLSEVNYGTSGRPRSLKGTLPRSRSQSDLGAL